MNMKIVQYLQDAFSWMKSKSHAAYSRWRDEGPEIGHAAMAQVGAFLTAPLNDVEYALLKRVSGIVGLAVAVYVTVAAGLITALLVLALCLILSVGLYQVSGPGPCLVQEPSSGAMMA
jgi:hypothetical protein